MPGIPQGRSIRETQGGSVTLVQIDENGVQATPLAVDLLRFAVIPVDLAGDGDLMDRFATALAAVSPGDAMLAARLSVSNAGPLAGDPAYVRQMAEEAAQTLPGVYIEAVRFTAAADRAAPAIVADLAALMQQDAATPGFRDEAAAAVEEWRRALPREIADVLDPSTLDDLIVEGLDTVIMRLATATDRS